MAEEKKELSPFWYDKVTREIYANTAKINDVIELIKKLESSLVGNDRNTMLPGKPIMICIDKTATGAITYHVRVSAEAGDEAKTEAIRLENELAEVYGRDVPGKDKKFHALANKFKKEFGKQGSV